MNDAPHRFEMRLPSNAGSVRLARRFVTSVLGEALREDERGLIETAGLLVSELATNAVLHARTPFTVTVEASEGCVRVEVYDSSPVLPARRPYTVTASTGRGIAIIHDLATDEGAERRGGGKVVWFELSRGEPGIAASERARRRTRELS